MFDNRSHVDDFRSIQSSNSETSLLSRKCCRYRCCRICRDGNVGYTTTFLYRNKLTYILFLIGLMFPISSYALLSSTSIRGRLVATFNPFSIRTDYASVYYTRRNLQTYSQLQHLNQTTRLMASRLKQSATVTVPLLFASEAHRGSFIRSNLQDFDKVESKLDHVISATENSAIAVAAPSSASTAAILTADKEAVMDVVFPLYGDFLRVIQSIQVFGGLVYRFVTHDRRRLMRKGGRTVTWWSDHPIFQRLCAYAFNVCATCTSCKHDDTDTAAAVGDTTTTTSKSSGSTKKCKTNLCSTRIDRNQVYAGILLVHLQLAPYLGVAACHPPSREMVDEMFEKADLNELGTIGLEEFTDILILSFTHISSRILMYYGILLVGLPLAAKQAYALIAPIQAASISAMSSFVYNPLEWLNLQWLRGLLSLTGLIVERIICVSIFIYIVPTIFNYIDRRSEQLLKPKRLKRRRRQLTWRPFVWGTDNDDTEQNSGSSSTISYSI